MLLWTIEYQNLLRVIFCDLEGEEMGAGDTRTNNALNVSHTQKVSRLWLAVVIYDCSFFRLYFIVCQDKAMSTSREQPSHQGGDRRSHSRVIIRLRRPK